MSSIKYLYGKREKLNGLLQGKRSIRFCDIRHYGRLENSKIRDSEDKKRFEFKKNEISLEINGKTIEDLASNVVIDSPSRLCYCLCLSNQKDSEKLYDKFDADICIEINIERLAEFLTQFLGKEKDVEIIHKKITYYDYGQMGTPQDNVFMKHKTFQDEDEYRLAIFLPFDENSLLLTENGKVPFLQKCKCEPEKLKSCQCYFLTIRGGGIFDSLLYVHNKHHHPP